MSFSKIQHEYVNAKPSAADYQAKAFAYLEGLKEQPAEEREGLLNGFIGKQSAVVRDYPQNAGYANLLELAREQLRELGNVKDAALQGQPQEVATERG